MSSIVVWILSIALAASALVLTAAAAHATLHLALAGMVTTVIVAVATREYRAAFDRGETAAVLLSITARYLGVLWAWSAICLILTYSLIMVWSAWGNIFIGSALFAGLCLLIANVVERSTESDVGLRSLASGFIITTFAISTVALGAIPVLVGYAGFAGGKSDWAAVNILLTTIGGLAFVSGLAIALKVRPQAA